MPSRMKGGLHIVGQAGRLARGKKEKTAKRQIHDQNEKVRKRYEAGKVTKEEYKQFLAEQEAREWRMEQGHAMDETEARKQEKAAKAREIPKRKKIPRNKPAKKRTIPLKSEADREAVDQMAESMKAGYRKSKKKRKKGVDPKAADFEEYL